MLPEDNQNISFVVSIASDWYVCEAHIKITFLVITSIAKIACCLSVGEECETSRLNENNARGDQNTNNKHLF